MKSIDESVQREPRRRRAASFRLALAHVALLAGILSQVALSSGCSLDRGALSGAGGGADGGGIDAHVDGRDAGPDIDGGPDDRDGGGADPDAFIGRDSGVGCDFTGARCDGELVVQCTDGVRTTRNCFEGSAYCEAGDCILWSCTPGEGSCAEAVQRTCDARGIASVTTPCTRGCGGGNMCRPQTACSLAVHAAMGVGTMRVNTCGQGNDASTSCVSSGRSGADLIIRLEVPADANYRIDLDAVGGDDPLLYIRRACNDGSSQMACNDDRSGGTRSSRIDITLARGDYFVVVDSYRDSGEAADGRCGDMDLTISIR